MFPSKRKAAESGMQRRVRARRQSSQEREVWLSAGNTQFRTPVSVESEGRGLKKVESELDSKSGSVIESESDSGLESDLEQGLESEAHTLDTVASISFGALAKAQALTSRSRGKRKSHGQNGDGWENNEELERHAGRKDHRDFNRSSKHAPTEISSKKAVSRRREVVPVAKLQHRDPRFEPSSGEAHDTQFKMAYSFLDEYRENEMNELKAAIKSSKDEDAKERLKRALHSMESRKKGQLKKDKEQEILNRHRKEEKDLVRQGKQPFYLKKSEQKKRVLLDQYDELKGKQLDRVIERRRKKIEGKEKKKMPFKRRGASI